MKPGPATVAEAKIFSSVGKACGNGKMNIRLSRELRVQRVIHVEPVTHVNKSICEFAWTGETGSSLPLPLQFSENLHGAVALEISKERLRGRISGKDKHTQCTTTKNGIDRSPDRYLVVAERLT